MGVEPRRVEDHQPAGEQRVRIAHDGMAPGGHFHEAAFTGHQPLFPARVDVKTQGLGLIDGNTPGFAHALKRLLHRGQILRVVGLHAPALAPTPRLVQRDDLAARVDRQQQHLRARPSNHSISVGHMVVRPLREGSARAPSEEKTSALMSSDLPRENSATKARRRHSSRSRSRAASSRLLNTSFATPRDSSVRASDSSASSARGAIRHKP